MKSLKERIKVPAFLKTPRFRKAMKKTLIALLIVGGFFGATGIFINYYYEDTVKSIIISELNKRLNCDITYEDIDFSVFRRFPYATLHFSGVTAFDAHPDTSALELNGRKYNPKSRYNGISDSILMTAEDVDIQMSLLDLLFAKYRVKRVELNDALLSLKVFKDGTDNYHVLKPSTDTSHSENFKFDLQKLVLKNTECRYLNLRSSQDYQLTAEDVKLKGEFTSNEYMMDVDGDVFVHHITSDGVNYFSEKNTVLGLRLDVNDSTQIVRFTDGDLRLGDLRFLVRGYVAYGKTDEMIDLNVEGKDLALNAFLQQLPGIWKEIVADYQGSGNFTFNANVKGHYGNNRFPQFSAGFSLDKGEIMQKESGIKLSDVALQAQFTNGAERNSRTSELNISSFSATLMERGLEGNMKLINFDDPFIDLEAKGSFDLTDLQGFIQADTLSAMSGLVDFNFSFEGKLGTQGRFSASDFVNSKSSGTLSLQDGMIAFNNQNLQWSGLNGNFEFNNNDIISHNFRGKVGSTDFTIDGYFRNLFSFLLLEDERLGVKASFASQSINMDELLQYNVSSGDSTRQLNLSPYLDLNLDVSANNFTMGKFSATNAHGKLEVQNRQIRVKDFNVSAMGGHVSVNGRVDAREEGRLLIGCDAVFTDVDIRQMFYQLNNFGQPYLSDQHLKGQLSARVSFASEWSNTFQVDMGSVVADADITIKNGELIKYPPIEGLSSQLKNRNFSNIKFATLGTHITISNRLINIPETKIVNDAIDFTIEGTHTFDNQIDYHVSILFADLINKKNNAENEFGQVEDDGLHKERYFFRITGTTEDPIYQRIDKRAYGKSIKKNLKEQGKTLKELWKQTFGKKDTVGNGGKDGKTPDDVKPGDEWEIEWE